MKINILLMGDSLTTWIIKHASVKSISITVIIVALFINEFLIYWIQTSRWPTFPDVNTDRNKELVVMLVSDPQLQGLQDEPGFPIGAFSRWDADRFISKTFRLAYSYSQPDVVIFLGDLMDEGSKATPEEYQSYFDRFNSIFAYAKQSKVIYIPGDNDIGGEGRDFMTQAKISRFQQYFGEMGAVVNSEFVDFLKLGLRSDMPVASEESLEKYRSEMKSPFRIIISHESLLPKLKVYIYPILRKIEPQLILSGHWHKSMVYNCDSCINDNADSGHWPVHRRFLSDIYDFMYIDVSNREAIHELMIPTCSYRMGVADMGYGLAIINEKKSIKYTVLWLPRRYTILYSYIFVIVFLLLLKLLSLKCLPFLKRKAQNFKHS